MPAPRWLELLSFGVSAGGYLFMGLLLIGLVATGWLVPGGGDVRDVYHSAGNALWTGQPVYAYNFPPYFYSAGNWRRVGYMLWIFPIAYEIVLGNVNLIVAAAIVAAVREGRTALPAAMTFAKFSPVLAVNPRQWRPFALWILLGLAITIPWWWLWPEWLGQMGRAWNDPVGPLVPIPFLVRLPVALVLVATRTRLGRAAGAVIAIPALYFLSVVVLIAPISIALDLLEERRIRRARALPRPAHDLAPGRLTGAAEVADVVG